MAEHQGRLELTWTNKHLRLLAHEDGRYEWVSPSDHRVAEVRLLDDVTTVGDVSTDRAKDNLLIQGDALNALRSLARLPEFASEYLGNVKLAYLDPPFNTQQSFLHYDVARRWANYVNADEKVRVTWRYLLVSESDVDTAKGSWSALKKLGGE